MCFESDIAGVASLRNYFSNNPFIAYLDINSMRNKITHLEDVLSKSPINITCVDETKVESSLPDSRLKIERYQISNIEKR